MTTAQIKEVFVETEYQVCFHCGDKIEQTESVERLVGDESVTLCETCFDDLISND